MLYRDKTKVLVLGASGMLGHMVFNVLSSDNHFTVFGTDLKKMGRYIYFDALQGIETLKKVCHKRKFDYLINCIGITKNKIDELDIFSVAKAIRINTLFPHELAVLADHYDAKVIQISTDGVFSSNAGKCNEDSRCYSDDVYGLTKRLGEVNNGNFLNIRCSIIGPSPHERGGLLEWFLSRPDKSTVEGYVDHIWNGVTTLQYALLCRKIIAKGVFDKLISESGTHHFCPNKAVSKYTLLKLLKAALGKKIKIIPIENRSESVKRILFSRHKSIGQLFGDRLPMNRAISELADVINNRTT